MSMHHAYPIFILFLSLLHPKLIHLTRAENIGHHNHDKETFIVRIDNEAKPSDFSTIEEWYKSILTNVNSTPNDDPFLHVYKTVFHGFSTHMFPDQARALEAHPSVVGVFPEQIYQLHTTRTPHFLGLNSYHSPMGLLKDSELGSNVVIGMIDTGIWPESPSFRDEGLGPVPTHFKGTCDGGKDFPSSLCNKKLVGARYFFAGMAAASAGPAQFNTARDHVGHGTHTASTAAGQAQTQNASFFGYAPGEATGIAPKARLAVYKVCWSRMGCSSSDVLAGIDKAAEDGVDVISLSLGGLSSRYSYDPIAMAAYGAVKKGVFFSASAGNRGPFIKTVTNVAPWITTAGASTLDRTFPADLVLGNGHVLTGTSIYTAEKQVNETQYFPIVHVNSSPSAAMCLTGALPPKTVEGKIVICMRGGVSSAMKGVNVKSAGGVGLVIANDEMYGEGLYSEAYFGIPALTLTNSGRMKLLDYYQKSTQDAKARFVFHGTKVPSGPAPAVAAFSSRGPNTQAIYVLKPDIIAPGVDVLASWPNELPPSGLPEDARRSGFNILPGTSMSCPHVSGVAALLKGAHPDWTPAMIRSAMMTTAYRSYLDGKPFIAQENNMPASIWLRGSGHVDPEKANDPGLVYDLSEDDYVDFLCASNYSKHEIKVITKKEVSCDSSKKAWNLNYPAIIVASTLQVGRMNKIDVTVTRTLTNVGSTSSTYRAEIVSPEWVTVNVKPTELSFNAKGEKKSFEVQVVFEGERGSVTNPKEGSLTWTEGEHMVTTPLVLAFI